MNSLGTCILLVLIFVVLGAPRRFALLGMMAGVLYLTQAQMINLGGLNLFANRFLELAGFVRVMARREFAFSALNRIDRSLILLYSYATGVFLLRSSESQAFAIGTAADALLSYFTFRGLIGNIEDFRQFLRSFLMLLVPFTLLVVTESVTVHNPFASLGGVEAGGVWMRNGRPRCFGSFRQPDLLGMFGASFVPLYVGLACVPRERICAIIGVCMCFIIAWAANSGGAAAATGLGLLGWFFWPMRTKMRKVRWGIVGTIALMAVTMNAPVWFIFARISSITGGDGYHRSRLMDVAFKHISEWWLAGMPIEQTVDWFAYSLNNHADITNQFLSFGLGAGVGGIALFIVLLKRSYAAIGKAMTAVRSTSLETDQAEVLFWSVGVVLTVHIVNWFGITYFDQTYLVWFMELAVISGLAENRAGVRGGNFQTLTTRPAKSKAWRKFHSLIGPGIFRTYFPRFWA